MGEHEPVITDHNGKERLFSDLECLDDGVQHFLAVSAVKLNPAGVSLSYGVLLVVKNSPGSPHAAVHACHHYRDSASSGPV